MKKSTRKSKAHKKVKHTAAASKASKAVKGKKVGKKRLLSDAQIVQLKQLRKSGKMTVSALCRKFKISVPTFYNYLKIKVK